MSRRVPRPLRTALATVLTGVLALGALGVAAIDSTAPAGSSTAVDTAPVAAKRSTNPVTPGDFTGYGFDQCLTPSQAAMNRWLNHSPYLAVGIYISGDSRACRKQPNLTPAWVATQLRKGWRLLPITLGPQASCLSRFPRYADDVSINPAPGADKMYRAARRMGQQEATKAVEAAGALGIVAGSTLWYDLEGYDNNNTHCRESAMAFLSGWTTQIRALGYVSGVYSSAGSGIKQLEAIRVRKDTRYTLPDRIWIARWDGKANTSTTYISEQGWRPGGRVKQYRGGHDETWGKVRINVDSNYLDLGRGSIAPAETHCGGVRIDYSTYVPLRRARAGYTPGRRAVRALQCLLKEQGVYAGPVNGVFNRRLLVATRTWSAGRGLRVSNAWSRGHWMALHATGPAKVLKVGSAGAEVRRVQRALNAVNPRADRVAVSGLFDARTKRAVRSWQGRVRLARTGIVSAAAWRLMLSGTRKR